MVNVEINVENPQKSPFKTLEKLVKLKHIFLFNVYKINIQHFFHTFSPDFSTMNSPLFFPNLFHYSTPPTITTTKYYKLVKERS